MAKTQQDRRQQILDAALRVFAKHGLHKATIKQISEEAQLKSSALLYWYFKDKDEIFAAVLKQLSPLMSVAENPEELLERPPEEVFPMIAMTFFRTFEEPDAKRLFRIFISEAARAPKESEQYVRGGIFKIKNLIIKYLERQVELGKLRPLDAQSVTRAFMGTMFMYMMNREVFLPMREGLPDPERYVEQVVSIFLDGLQTQQETK